MTYLDKDEKPMTGADGYATFKSSYDQRGNKTRETYYGPNGEPVLSKKWADHGWEAEYDEHGNQTVITYLGLDGKPTLLPDGYSTMKSPYDERGKPIRVTFCNINGEPALSKENGYYGWQAEYDEQGNKTVSTCLGKDGKPMPGADGYATVRLAYDSRSNVTRVTYHAANGEAIKSKKNGYYGWEAKYDDQGNKTVTYLGKDGKPITGKQR